MVSRMPTCADLTRSMAPLKKQLALLEKSGKGHSLQHQDLLDQLAVLENLYRAQGCYGPPPPRLGTITTTVLSSPVYIDTGGVGELTISIQASNDGLVDTSVEYSIDPPVADLTQSGNWTVPIVKGTSTLRATLTIAASDTAAVGTRTVAIHENIIFGPVKDGAHQQYDYVVPDTSVVIGLDPAYAAIEAKAQALGVNFTGGSVEATQRLTWLAPTDGKAYRRRYQNCSIYYSAAFGAHEIHGAIRDKFDQLPKPTLAAVPVVLGIPVTDESGSPDGVGRYNHFSNDGSIYWHPETGPFAVYGPLRETWAAAGWEMGQYGYPTQDTYIPDPNETSYNIFCVFQNGVLWERNGLGDASAVKITSAETIRDQIWQQFNSMLPSQTVREDVGPVTFVGQPGLAAETSTDTVSGNGYGFWAARNRIMTVTLHGFVSMNWALPDPTFDAHLSLLFYQSHTGRPFDGNQKPDDRFGGQSLYAELTALTVHASGLYNGTVAAKLSEQIRKALYQPLQVQTKSPSDPPPLLELPIQPPDLFAIIVGQDGSLAVHHTSAL